MNDDINITHTHTSWDNMNYLLFDMRDSPKSYPILYVLWSANIYVWSDSHTLRRVAAVMGGGVYDPALSDDSIGCLSVFLLIDITFVECRRRRHVWKSVWNDVTKSCLCKWRIINWISYLRATQSNHSHLQRRGGLNGDHPTSSVWGVCVCMCGCSMMICASLVVHGAPPRDVSISDDDGRQWVYVELEVWGACFLRGATTSTTYSYGKYACIQWWPDK